MIRDTISLLFLLPSFTFGGAERTSLNLLKGIDKTRFRITLITSNSISQRFQNSAIQKFIPLEDLEIDVWYNNLNRFTEDTKRVAALLEKEKPDLAFGMMHYPSSLLVFAKKLNNLKLKVIASPRGPSSEYLEYFEHDFYRKLVLRRIFSFCCKYADGLVVASQGMKDECVREFSGDPTKIAIIPNSIDFDDIQKKCKEPTDGEIPSGSLLISTAGRLEKEKNHTFLLKAFAEARKYKDIKLIIIGEGSEKKYLQRFAHDLGITGNVIFMGYQSNPYKYIKRSRIFVHTCLFEGFANSIIEAMSCCVPVIATDCPYGPGEIVKDKENGLLVDINDSIGMVRAINSLLLDRKLHKKLSLNGLRTVKKYSIEKMSYAYQKFFYKTIGQ